MSGFVKGPHCVWGSSWEKEYKWIHDFSISPFIGQSVSSQVCCPQMGIFHRARLIRMGYNLGLFIYIYLLLQRQVKSLDICTQSVPRIELFASFDSLQTCMKTLRVKIAEESFLTTGNYILTCPNHPKIVSNLALPTTSAKNATRVLRLTNKLWHTSKTAQVN